MSFHQKILSLLLPRICRVCEKILPDSKLICDDCLQKIQWISHPLCTVCGMPFKSETGISHPCISCLEDNPPFDAHRSCAVYDKTISRLVYRLKYSAGFDVLELFADWVMERHAGFISDADCLVPVPLSIPRLRKRTFNQSLELAKIVSRRTGVAVLIHSLKKISDTVPQTELPREERLKNLRGAFEWNDSTVSLKGKKVLLIDDVFTTGSTLSACAATLRRQKPAMVGAMTVAFNLPDKLLQS